MKPRLHERLIVWEQKIRSARGAEVAADIAQLRPATIPRDKKAAVANLARRVGLYRYALTLLRDDFLEARERPEENEVLIAEYAATLTEIGASAVAERLFSLIETPRYEMTPFYKALLWMKVWRYDRVPAEIAAFHTISNDTYRKQIADVNLVAALNILGRYPEAEAKLSELEKIEELSPMMRGILNEQHGQLLFFTKQTAKAREHFTKSYEALRATNNPSALYAEKWLAILDLFEHGTRPAAEFIKRAEAAGFWEVLRELERFEAVKLRSEETLAKLYYGSPAEGYRALLKRELAWSPPSSFTYPAEARASYNTKTGQLIVDGRPKKMPVTFVRLLTGLSRDLYRPVAVGSLFEVVYPGEFFHPKFASQRIYKIIARMRDFFEAQQLALSIDASDLGFKLRFKSGEFALIFEDGKREEMKTLKSDILEMVEKHFGTREFTAAEFADATAVPKRSVNRALKSEVESGTVDLTGQGRGSRYRLKRASN